LNADSLTIDSERIHIAKGNRFCRGHGPGAGGFYSGTVQAPATAATAAPETTQAVFVYGSALTSTDLGSGGANGNSGR